MSLAEGASISKCLYELLEERKKYPERFENLPCEIIEKPVVRKRTQRRNHRNRRY